MTIKERLDAARDDLHEAAQVARRRDAREDELIQMIRRLRSRRDNVREEREEVEDQDERERLADRIDEIEHTIDRLVNRLDRVERRSDAADAELREEKERVARLRKRRDRVEAASSTRISEHFVLSEFDCHAGDPCPDYMVGPLRDHADDFLEPMRDRFGPAHVNSGHRWDWYNRSIGGATLSYHVYENRKKEPATDLTFERGTPAEWAAYARQLANALGFGGVGQYATFVHVDSGPRRDWSG